MFSLGINFIFAASLSTLGEPLEAEGDYKESEMGLVVASSEHTERAHAHGRASVSCRVR